VPKQAKGEVRFSAGIWRARVTLKGKLRLDGELPTCRDLGEAEVRALLLTEQARHLRLAGKVETAGADALLRELGAAGESALSDVILVIGELCGAPTLPARLEGPTFADVAKQWTDGDLAREWPDHVKAKDSDPDERRLKLLNALEIDGRRFREIPVSRLRLEHAKAAMRLLPKKARRPATRRHYAQCIARVLSLAVYPLRLIKATPLPKGFLPKVGKPPAFSYLYPAEDATLLARDEIPLQERLLFGFLAREGMRLSEALGLVWRDIDLDRGTVSLDANKTDDARTWALDAGVMRALKVVFDRCVPEQNALAFPSPEGTSFEASRLADLLRARLWQVHVRRAELHTKGENRGQFRVHDLRGTFVTLSLANGKSETWVADRTGHTSSIMINRYRRAARTAAELNLGALPPLDAAIPDLGDYPRIAHGDVDSGAGGDEKSSLIDAGGPFRTRTGMPSRAKDFKSPASAIPPRGHMPRSDAPSVHGPRNSINTHNSGPKFEGPGRGSSGWTEGLNRGLQASGGQGAVLNRAALPPKFPFLRGPARGRVLRSGVAARAPRTNLTPPRS